LHSLFIEFILIVYVKIETTELSYKCISQIHWLLRQPYWYSAFLTTCRPW